MFSRLLGSGRTSSTSSRPTGAAGANPSEASSGMKANARRYFSRGVDCNMKVVIRGDRKCGKSTLMKLLQGEKFSTEHEETPEIEVANISWRYKTSDDVVKVEVWDVVDHGTRKKPQQAPGIKSGADDEPVHELPALDAQTVDVYKGTHGVIFMYDICKKWTWDYVQREIELVPSSLPVLVLANFRDQHAHREVQSDEAAVWLETGLRRDAPICFAEASLSNGFGLMFVYRFFAIPFLNVQHATVLARLKSIQEEIATSEDEIKLYCFGSDEQDYGKFMENRERRRQKKENKTSGAGEVDAAAAAAAAYVPPLKADETGAIKNELAPPSSDDLPRRSSFGSRLRGLASGSKSSGDKKNPKPQPTPVTIPSAQSNDGKAQIDNFNAGNVDETFWPNTSKENSSQDTGKTNVTVEIESDSDNDAPNMLVQADGSDIEISDTEDVAPTKPTVETDNSDDGGPAPDLLVDGDVEIESISEPAAPKRNALKKAANDTDSSDGFGTDSAEEPLSEEEEELEEEDRAPALIDRPIPPSTVSSGATKISRNEASPANPPEQSKGASTSTAPPITSSDALASEVPETEKKADSVTPKPAEVSKPTPKKKKETLVFAAYESPAPRAWSPEPITSVEPLPSPEDTAPAKEKQKKKKKKKDKEKKKAETPKSQKERQTELESQLAGSQPALVLEDSLDSWLDAGDDFATPSAEGTTSTSKTKGDKDKAIGSGAGSEAEVEKKKKKKKKKKEKKEKSAVADEYDAI